MLGGVANFLGTYWPVGDFAAKTFADRFYAWLPGGCDHRRGHSEGARWPSSRDPKDWANYVFYGDPSSCSEARIAVRASGRAGERVRASEGGVALGGRDSARHSCSAATTWRG